MYAICARVTEDVFNFAAISSDFWLTTDDDLRIWGASTFLPYKSTQTHTHTQRTLSSVLTTRLSDSYMMRKSTAHRHTLTKTRHRPSVHPSNCQSIRRNDRRYQPPHPLTKTTLATLLTGSKVLVPPHPLRTHTHSNRRQPPHHARTPTHREKFRGAHAPRLALTRGSNIPPYPPAAATRLCGKLAIPSL